MMGCADQDSPAAVDTAASASPPAADAGDVARAQTLLDDVVKAYRSAPAMTDVVELIVQVQDAEQEEKQVVEVAFGPGSNAQIASPNSRIVAVDGMMYIERDDVSDKYFSRALEGTIGQTLRSMFGDGRALPLPLALRELEPGQNPVNVFALAMLANVQLAGVTTIKDGERSFEDVAFSSPDGTGVARIDSKTKLVRNVKLHITPQGGPEGFSVTMTCQLNPHVSDAPATPIAFDPGDRQAVDDMQNLQPKPLTVGDPAPDFELTTLDGETVALSQLKGSVVVLDFWATWCGPCRAALPQVQEFADWARESGKPIRVFTVNGGERLKTDDEKLARVRKFWTDSKYTMPVLMDFKGVVNQKYGVSSIPRTFIIGPDGVLRKTHSGMFSGMTDLLKTESLELLPES
jgi:peroxiredoxin